MITNAVFIYVAMFFALAAAIPPGNINNFTPAPVAANLFKREVTTDKDWCLGKIHESQGTWRPTSAACDWALDRSFSVICEQEDVSHKTTVQSYCPIGTLCEQREEVVNWKGLRTYDVDCVPSQNLVKWAIGTRQTTGQNYANYCSNRISYLNKGARSVLAEFFATYWGTTGQKTQVYQADIYLNDQSIQHDVNSNQVSTKHVIKPGDIIRYCVVRGSSALIEGYATAKILKYIGSNGVEEEVAPGEDSKLVVHELE
ncbi:hypothetical protein PtrSN001C_012007 [Pyrenophora tritici-repentis]|nr:hypothetical protein PtrSN001C_012007 [Pyrenophora tritici-repentis]